MSFLRELFSRESFDELRSGEFWGSFLTSEQGRTIIEDLVLMPIWLLAARNHRKRAISRGATPAEAWFYASALVSLNMIGTRLDRILRELRTQNQRTADRAKYGRLFTT